MDARIIIKNYKKLRDVDVKMHGGNMYMVTGKNGVGKTSFLQAFLELIQGIKANKDKLTFDEEKGFVTGVFTFNGADNKVYTVNMEYTDKTSKFTILRPDGTTSNKKTDIGVIFGYNHFTIEDFFGWGLTAEGQKKQAKVLLELLNEEDRKRIAEIDGKISPSKGELFLKRRDINRDMEANKNSMRSQELNEQEAQIAEEAKNWQKAYDAMVIELEDMKKRFAGVDAKKEQIETLKQQESDAIFNKESFESDKKQMNERLDQEKKALEDKLKLIEQQRINGNQKFDRAISEQEEKAKTAKQSWMTIEKNLPEGIELLSVKEEELKQNRNAIETAKSILDKQKYHEYHKKKFLELEKDSNDLTQKIEKLRKEKKKLISNIKGIDNLEIVDDMLYLKEGETLIPFNEQSISYSEGGLIVFKIMTMVNNKLPLWVIGKAREYDDDKLAKFANIAKQTGGIIVADMVDSTEEKFKIEVRDESDKH